MIFPIMNMRREKLEKIIEQAALSGEPLSMEGEDLSWRT